MPEKNEKLETMSIAGHWMISWIGITRFVCEFQFSSSLVESWWMEFIRDQVCNDTVILELTTYIFL